MAKLHSDPYFPQGVLSGGSGSCSGSQGNNGGGNSYYTPIKSILSAYSLTLRTSP